MACKVKLDDTKKSRIIMYKKKKRNPLVLNEEGREIGENRKR
jgi:hypothetical protein